MPSGAITTSSHGHSGSHARHGHIGGLSVIFEVFFCWLLHAQEYSLPLQK